MGIEILKEKIIKSIEINDDEIIFHISEQESYKMHHNQDCCESVVIEDICGELDWLIDSPILLAEERESDNEKRMQEQHDTSETWTFYELATIKGSVTIRWYGSSNGYYSESIDFERV